MDLRNSSKKNSKKNFCIFFKDWLFDIIKLPQYYDNFKEHSYDDIRMIQDFDNDVFDDMNIKSKIHKKLLLRNITVMKDEINLFDAFLKNNKLNNFKIYKKKNFNSMHIKNDNKWNEFFLYLNNIGIITLNYLKNILIKYKNNCNIFINQYNTNKGIPKQILNNIYKKII